MNRPNGSSIRSVLPPCLLWSTQGVSSPGLRVDHAALISAADASHESGRDMATPIADLVA